jgi:Ca2+-binding EF-hand superfamily protein
MASENPLLIKFRSELLSRGASGIKNFGRYFRVMDKDDSSTVTLNEFIEFTHSHNIRMTSTEIAKVFKLFESDQKGTINYNEFLEAVRVI